MGTWGRGWTAAGLWLLLVAELLAFLVLWRYAVHTGRGQWLDTVALTGNSIGRERIATPVNGILNAMSVVSLLAVTAVIGFIALIRRRILLAVMAMLLIVGASATTQVLKHTLTRPDLGIDPERAAAGNSLPSGHAAVAASVAVALVLVLPARVRAFGALLGAAYAAAAGVATLSAGWHRPSDAAAAFLLVGAWGALAGLVLLRGQPEQAQVDRTDAHRTAAKLLAVGGLLLLVVSAVALASLARYAGADPAELGRRALLIGYGGSAAGIAGTVCLVMAPVVRTVHRLVPRYPG